MIIALIITLIGISFGSFGNNIVSHYINDQKIDFSRSLCQCSERKLKFLELIPILSFVFLWGNCNVCSERLSKRYLLTEVLSGILAITLYLKFDLSMIFVISFIQFYIMLLIAIIDFYKFIIPNSLLLVLFFFALLNIFFYPEQLFIKLISSISLTLMFIGINSLYSRYRSIEAIGAGDIKFLGILMLLFSFPLSLVGLWISAIIALPSFYIVRYFHNDWKKTNLIPFGSFISLGYLVTILIYHWLENSYFQIILGQF